MAAMTPTNEARDREVLVVGGGAAGILAAKRAAERGAKVTLLEKNDRIGMKILISGGGKCNLTHAGSIEDIRAAFRPNEARFLTPSLYRFTNDDFISILHQSGIRTYVRPDGRVFPVEPADAKDVVAILRDVMCRAGVIVQTKAAVNGLVAEGGQIVGVRIGDQVRRAERVIVAVGGSSYPATGTTGDGWRWVSELGHTVVALRAALAPLYLQHAEPDWSGIALRDIILRARSRVGGKEYVRWRGDLLFTHKGLSGPCALGISRKVAETIASGVPLGGELEIDLAPDLSFEALQAQIRSKLKENPRKTVSSIIDEYIPRRLEEPFATAAGVDLQMKGANLPAKLLNKLVSTLKGWPLGGVRSVPLERGEVVAGGVDLDEVDPKTMESRRVKGLYLCGEILDIAGPVGGYNLQAAWSTGYVAGESAANAG
jgi:predicted Rossmann fold flavoprotein